MTHNTDKTIQNPIIVIHILYDNICFGAYRMYGSDLAPPGRTMLPTSSLKMAVSRSRSLARLARAVLSCLGGSSACPTASPRRWSSSGSSIKAPHGQPRRPFSWRHLWPLTPALLVASGGVRSAINKRLRVFRALFLVSARFFFLFIATKVW